MIMCPCWFNNCYHLINCSAIQYRIWPLVSRMRFALTPSSNVKTCATFFLSASYRKGIHHRTRGLMRNDRSCARASGPSLLVLLTGFKPSLSLLCGFGSASLRLLGGHTLAERLRHTWAFPWSLHRAGSFFWRLQAFITWAIDEVMGGRRPRLWIEVSQDIQNALIEKLDQDQGTS